MRLLCTVRECHAPLEIDERRAECARGHVFDVARSGYVNLLQPQDRRSNAPGDTKDAVAARRRFLDAGYAQPLVDAIVRALPLASGAAMLDAGCGDGHHAAAFRRAYSAEVCGIDISTAAIDLAARRHRDCLWLVANADRFLPFEDESLDAVTSITARMNPAEFHRVLAPGGRLLVAIPGAEDLVELREAIQGERIERERTARTTDLFAPHFRLVHHETITHVATLDPAAMADALTSTYRGLRHRERDRLAQMKTMPVTLSQDVLVFTALKA